MTNFYLIIFFLITSCSVRIAPVSQFASIIKEPVVSTCNERCMTTCRENFIDSASYKKCTLLSDKDVNSLDRAFNSMSRGSWTSINEGQISLLSNISYDPWIKYSSKSSEKMLEWIGESRWMGDYLENEVLKAGLSSLSYLPKEKAVLDGLEKNIFDKRNLTFIEFVAWEKNEDVFKKIHDTILDVCENSKCAQKVYCAQSSDIVIETINNLDLADDISSRDRFHRGLCQ